jgi:homoserine O-acetyltransferase
VLLIEDCLVQPGVPAVAAPRAAAGPGVRGWLLHGAAARRPQGICRDLCRLGFSEPFYRTEGYRAFSARNTQEFVEYFWEPAFIHHDANNLLAMLWTWEHGDVSDNPLHGGDVAKALGSITARTIILPGQTDSYFPPVDSQREAELITGAECRTIPSIWGHMCLWNPADAPFIDTAPRDALGEV